MEKNISAPSKWLNIEEVHKEYGFSPSWLYKNTATRKIPFYKPAGRIYFLRDDLDRWIQNSAIGVA